MLKLLPLLLLMWRLRKIYPQYWELSSSLFNWIKSKYYSKGNKNSNNIQVGVYNCYFISYFFIIHNRHVLSNYKGITYLHKYVIIGYFITYSGCTLCKSVIGFCFKNLKYYLLWYKILPTYYCIGLGLRFKNI
jgi:hypothetical protein